MSGLRDVAIIGAGPVGAVLALALADADLDIVVFDARAPGASARGERALAIAHGARLILERVGVWGELAATPGAVTAISTIDVSQADGFGTARLEASEHRLAALGYVVSSSALQAVLDAALRRTAIELQFGVNVQRVSGTRGYAAVLPAAGDALLARLAVVADGAGAALAGIVRHRHDYRRSALVARVWTRAPHDGVAFERFAAEGPVALLPEQDHYALIWTAPPERIAALCAMEEDDFLRALRSEFTPRRTDFVRTADRRAFPLVLEMASSVVSTRCAMIGNAAQALHPVAAQGLNLGLRDAHALAGTIVHAPPGQLGDDAMLSRYASRRRVDRIGGVAFTHGLLSVFANGHRWLSWPRGVALSALDALPAAKRAFTRAMLFGVR